MAKTFDDLGIPFPLFGGPVEDASEYKGVATCSLCTREGHCFSLGIGADVVTSCPGCGSVNAIDADDREGECSACAEALSIDDDAEELHACYACLREGKAALTKGTELGMIRWEDAVRGATTAGRDSSSSRGGCSSCSGRLRTARGRACPWSFGAAGRGLGMPRWSGRDGVVHVLVLVLV